MGSFFGDTPSAPREDPAVKAMRDNEQARAEGDRIRATQDNLTLETQIRRKLGLRSLLDLGSSGSLKSLLGGG